MPPPDSASMDQRGRVIAARCISRSLRERLQAAPLSAQVWAVFEHACNLVAPDTELIALVLPQVGDGPLNIVLDGTPDDFVGLEPGMTATLDISWVRFCGLAIALQGATVWEPSPDWATLRAHPAVMLGQLDSLRAIALQYAPEDSVLTILAGGPSPDPADSQDMLGLWGESPGGIGQGWDPCAASKGNLERAAYASLCEGARALRAGWQGDLAQLQAGAAQLAGLGTGLTPAGDDFLAGAMLWGWLLQEQPCRYARILAEAAIPRTTMLSAAFLRAAARGEFSVSWHRLLAAMSRREEGLLVSAVREVLAQGGTSGADTLAGFLWMGQSAMGGHDGFAATSPL